MSSIDQSREQNHGESRKRKETHSDNNHRPSKKQTYLDINNSKLSLIINNNNRAYRNQNIHSQIHYRRGKSFKNTKNSNNNSGTSKITLQNLAPPVDFTASSVYFHFRLDKVLNNEKTEKAAESNNGDSEIVTETSNSKNSAKTNTPNKQSSKMSLPESMISPPSIHIAFPRFRPVPEKTQKLGERLLVKPGEYCDAAVIQDKLIGILEKNSLELGIEQAISLRSWALSQKAWFKFSEIEKLAPTLSDSYESGKSVLALTEQHDFPPVSIFRSILKARGWSKPRIKSQIANVLVEYGLKGPTETTAAKFTKVTTIASASTSTSVTTLEDTTATTSTSITISKEKQTTKEGKGKGKLQPEHQFVLSDRDKIEFIEAHSSDCTNSNNDATLEKATLFEEEVAAFFRSQGVTFHQQSELISHQQLQLGKAVATPDLFIKLDQRVTVNVNGVERQIFWIEVKMQYGSDLKIQLSSIKEQVTKYKNFFGFGLLVYSLGFTDSVSKKFLKEDCCLCLDWRVVEGMIKL
eukprot:TRINITY_DN94_c0_g1_i1.p1 TRINITY_DN94_c0_g1~~TRINITY_DN94_c0_g1_i1.p1  ORF type:complete len:522 (+),score=103.27 TRINITY_DN94_c0_g1_i1:187-1752(+)